MEKSIMKKSIRRLAITAAVCAVLAALLIVGDVLCAVHSPVISSTLSPDKVNVTTSEEELEETLAAGDELVRRMGEEGTVLLKNSNGALPLDASEDKIVPVNLFIGDFYYTSDGSSGQATINEKKLLTLPAALEACHFKVNEISTKNKDADDWNDSDPDVEKALGFSDTAIAVISRVTGENNGASELTSKDGDGRMPIQLTTDEEQMLRYLGGAFDKTIVLINAGNTMELGFAEDAGIDALLYVSWPGQSGTAGVAKILAGETSPSGRLADTFVYDITKDPTWANNIKSGSQITYQENIYIGYRWYETADEEGYFDGESNSYGKGYDAVVQYPFGYGMSYTTFSRTLGNAKWTVDDVEYDAPDKAAFTDSKTTITIPVTVTNTGDVPGKEVVQLYVTPPYTKGGIEKAHVTLAAFGKTDVLYPADFVVPDDGDEEDYPKSQTLELTFDLYDIASYDCYDDNGNGTVGYELDPGEYTFSLKTDAHADAYASLTWTIPNQGTDENPLGYAYRFDVDTNSYVTNRFTGDYSLYAPVDGSTGGDPIKYMTRENFVSSFPTTRAANRSGSAVNQNAHYNGYDEDPDLVAPQIGVDRGEDNLYLYTLENGGAASLTDLEREGAKIVPNEDLIMTLGADYDDPLWDTLLEQVEMDEIRYVIESAGMGTKAMESIGKPEFFDKDGPAGFNNSVIGGVDERWTGFACENLIAMSWNTELAYEFGAALGDEGQKTGVDGNYGACVNLHRSSVNTRNFEAFSEDPLISGKLAARIITGATTRGLYVYLKHLVLSEPGQNPVGLNTWLTEQTLREIYLKPFEIAVKEGEANALMSAFNNVGGVPANAHYTLLTDVLRGEWKFRGSVITDYGMGYAPTFIRSGGDLKLNPSNGNANLSADNKADVYCGVRAIKNMLYTYCNTYYRAQTFDPTRVVELAEVEPSFKWWVLVVVAINVIVVGLAAWQLTVSIRAAIKEKKAASKSVES